MSSSPPQSVTNALESSHLDRGHLLGNFHNYYAFHPPLDRLEILHRSEALKKAWLCIQEQRRTTSVTSKNGRKRRRDDGEKEHGGDTITSATESSPENIQSTTSATTSTFTYCDLGCNEGDLTLKMAQSLGLVMMFAPKTKSECSNTKNCSKSNNDNDGLELKCLGLDIDSELIDRANEKKKDMLKKSTTAIAKKDEKEEQKFEEEESDDDEQINIDARFRVCNLLDASHHKKECLTFLKEISDGESDNTIEKSRFDLTTIFSTTMWIHVHGGDNGLTEFIRRVCDMTEALIIEPQPSKCYRNINARLRKMNRPEGPDTSSSRLTMRAQVESEIGRLVESFGFRRIVLFDDGNDDDDDGVVNSGEESKTTKVERTLWNRSILLYVRK